MFSSWKLISPRLPGIVLCSVLAACAQDVAEPALDSAASAAESHVVLVDPTTLAPIPNSLTFADRTAQCQSDPRVQAGLVTVTSCVGADLFFRETFNGNGRTCATCHPSSHNFTVDPTFIANLKTLNPSDPLFIAQNNSGLAHLEIEGLLESFALIRENPDGFQPPGTPLTRFVMRSVPHMFSLSTSIKPDPADGTTTPPDERPGWGGDGAPFNDAQLPNATGTLKNFLNGAIRQHYPKTLNRTEGTDFRFATATESATVSEFLHSIGRSNELTLTALTLADAGAEHGRKLFAQQVKPAGMPAVLACNGCHANAGATTGAPDLFNGNFNTGIENARISALNDLSIPTDGGFGTAPCSPSVNNNNCFGNGTFSAPPLIESVDTAPFFHTNAFATIEQAIAFYVSATFQNSPAGKFLAGQIPSQTIILTATEIADLGRLLRVLNASFNCHLALRRLNGVLTILQGTSSFDTVQGPLLALAKDELLDALTVLSDVSGLHNAAQSDLQSASTDITNAISASTAAARVSAVQAAIIRVTSANDRFTTSGTPTLSFTIGDGSLLF
jgi:cytochrome c peroxidase